MTGGGWGGWGPNIFLKIPYKYFLTTTTATTATTTTTTTATTTTTISSSRFPQALELQRKTLPGCAWSTKRLELAMEELSEKGGRGLKEEMT